MAIRWPKVRCGGKVFIFIAWFAAVGAYEAVLFFGIYGRTFSTSIEITSLNGSMSALAVLLSLAAGTLLSQGLMRLQTAQGQMKRIQYAIHSLTYTCVKILSVPDGAHSRGKEPLMVLYESSLPLQHLLRSLIEIPSEILALLASYPVALRHQAQRNDCQPDVIKLCREAAEEMKASQVQYDTAPVVRPRLQSGHVPRINWCKYTALGHPPTPAARATDQDLEMGICRHGHVRSDRFFEKFSKKLDDEFCQKNSKTAPYSLPQYIIHSLRCHVDNSVDKGYLDFDHSTGPNESLEMLALAREECILYSGRKLRPSWILWFVDICAKAVVLAWPITHGDWFLTGASWALLVRMMLLAFMSAIAMVMLREMWSMWDPFVLSIDMTLWTLDIAYDIDLVLNDWYEPEEFVPIRAHTFRGPKGSFPR